jgi:hypothetical protein
MQFINLHGVTEENALDFWSTNLWETVRDRRLPNIHESVRAYLASVLSHFSLQSIDRAEVLSPDYHPDLEEFRQFADLTQIAEMMMRQLIDVQSPLWMESAGAHILLYAGFFYRQNKERHNIPFFSTVGRNCYRMAAVGKRERVMKLIARRFDEYLFCLTYLSSHLAEKRYLIKVDPVAVAAQKMIGGIIVRS